MFERFTEPARQAIFFARYEASVLGSGWIETEHLLLGLFKVDGLLRRTLPPDACEAIRATIEQIPRPKPQIPPSVDLPLSHESKRVLAYGAEEAERMNHPRIDSGHLTLGLPREENCTAGTLLREYGINTDGYRTIVNLAQRAAPGSGLDETRIPTEPVPPAAPWLLDIIATLENLVEQTRKHLKRYADVYGEQRLKRKPWTRKQALGHLVDWASAHQQWLARALTEPKLVTAGYPLDEWASAQQYDKYAWQEIVDLWVSLNRLLVHVLAQIPEDRLTMACRIGVAEPMPLSKLIERYVEYCEDVVGQMLAHL
jgi:hypothetical protein